MLNKLVRITRDAEVKVTQNGKRMMSLSCVYDVGFGDNKKPVWCDFTMWGDRTENLAQYLTKGRQAALNVDDVEPHAYSKKDGTIATVLRGTIQKIEIIKQASAEGSKPQQAQPRAQDLAQSKSNDFDDFVDTIPF